MGVGREEVSLGVRRYSTSLPFRYLLVCGSVALVLLLIAFILPANTDGRTGRGGNIGGGGGEEEREKKWRCYTEIQKTKLALRGGSTSDPPADSENEGEGVVLKECGKLTHGLGERWGGEEGCSLDTSSWSASITSTTASSMQWRNPLSRSHLASLWNSARSLWDLPKVQELSRLASLIKHWAYSQFDGDDAGQCYSPSTGLLYLRIFKSGNDAIRKNLGDCKYGAVRQYDPLYLLRPDVCIFTFVRHPFEHFVSGYTEFEYRLNQWREIMVEEGKKMDPPPPTLDDSGNVEEGIPAFFDPTSSEGLGTEERAKAFVVQILSLSWMEMIDEKTELYDGFGIKKPWDTYLALGHIFPQAAAVTLFRPDYIGYLENFEYDWGMMQGACNVTLSPFDFSLGHHPGQSDPLNTTEAMQKLIATNHKVQRSLCMMYYYDFRLLGYTFPPACSFLEEEEW